MPINATIDYYPFGMQMPGRVMASGTYRYGFQGQEKDDEVYGEGNALSFSFRFYDPRIGRFLGVDPITREYPQVTPYNFAENDLIRSIDLWGLQKIIVDGDEWTRASTKIEIIVAEGDFLVKRPSVASQIGLYKAGSTNITSVSGRTARNIAEGGNLTRGESKQENALRHIIWSAKINSIYGKDVNIEATNAHEGISIDVPLIVVDLSQPFEGDMALADHTVDLLNNKIGRSISEQGDGQSTFEIASKALDVFLNEGLYTATQNDDGTISINRTKISIEQYAESMRRLVGLDENGFDVNEQKAIEKEQIKKK